MIEILKDYKFHNIHYSFSNDMFYVILRVCPIPDAENLYYVKEFKSKELCDALWQAVKEVI